MNYINYAENVFNNIVARIPDNNCVLINLPNGGRIIDAGITSEGGWSVAKSLLEGLIGGLGYVDFGTIKLNEVKIPTVDMFIDNPVKVADMAYNNNFKIKDLEVIGLQEEKDRKVAFGFAAAEKLPTEFNGNLIVGSVCSLIASVYNSSTPLFKAVKMMQKYGVADSAIVWGWSSCPVAIITDDPNLANKRQEVALNQGSIVSLWIREDDSKIEAFLKEWQLGELRIHNLVSAKTFIAGEINKELLINNLLG